MDPRARGRFNTLLAVFGEPGTRARARERGSARERRPRGARDGGLQGALQPGARARGLLRRASLPAACGAPRERTTISRYIGVYALYPAPGAHPLYESVGEANREGCRLPIYVGKAVPKGARTGQAEREGRTTASNNLYLRLREHRGSIEQAENLEVGDFYFRVAAMEIDLVAWGESVLIGHFQPVWNQIIPGFGIHDPGGGRAQQRRSVWDRLHPGRTAAKRLPVADPVDEADYEGRIDALSGRMRRELGLS